LVKYTKDYLINLRSDETLERNGTDILMKNSCHEMEREVERFMRIDEISKESLSGLQKGFKQKYKYDLNLLSLQYYVALKEQINELSNSSHIKINETKKMLSYSFSYAEDEYKDYIDFFQRYETGLLKVKKINEEYRFNYQKQNRNYRDFFNLDIYEDIAVEIENQLNKEECFGENERLNNTYILDDLLNVFNIDRKEADLLYEDEIRQYEQDIENIRMDFKKAFHEDLDTIYQGYKTNVCGKTEEKQKSWAEKHSLKKQIELTDMLKLVKEEASDYNIRNIYNYYWDMLSFNNIRTNVSTENTNIISHRRDSWNNDRKPLEHMYSTNASKTVPILYQDPIKPELLNESLVNRIVKFNSGIDHIGVVESIENEFKLLNNYTNTNMKLAVLLDLFWNLKMANDKITSLEVEVVGNNSQIEVDYDTNKVTLADFDSERDEKQGYIDQYNSIRSNISSGNLLYPLEPDLNIIYDNTEMKIKRIVTSKSLAEINMHLVFNHNIEEFYKKDVGNVKRKRFEEAYYVYSNMTSEEGCHSYYRMENLTGFNLSMKLYDYTHKLANAVKGDEKKKKTVDYLTRQIIDLLYKVKSPYLRLKLVDMVMGPFAYSETEEISINIMSLIAIKKLLQSYIDDINENYCAAYDAMLYYIGKRIIVSSQDDLKIMQGIQEMINEDYADYLRLSPKEIDEDRNLGVKDYGKNAFGLIWEEIVGKKRCFERLWYEVILETIMEQNVFISK